MDPEDYVGFRKPQRRPSSALPKAPADALVVPPPGAPAQLPRLQGGAERGRRPASAASRSALRARLRTAQRSYAVAQTAVEQRLGLFFDRRPTPRGADSAPGRAPRSGVCSAAQLSIAALRRPHATLDPGAHPASPLLPGHRPRSAPSWTSRPERPSRRLAGCRKRRAVTRLALQGLLGSQIPAAPVCSPDPYRPDISSELWGSVCKASRASFMAIDASPPGTPVRTVMQRRDSAVRSEGVHQALLSLSADAEVVDLSNRQLRPEDLLLISATLRGLPRVRVLDVSNNLSFCTPIGYNHLLELLEARTGIIELRADPLPEEWARPIVECLLCNRALLDRKEARALHVRELEADAQWRKEQRHARVALCEMEADGRDAVAAQWARLAPAMRRDWAAEGALLRERLWREARRRERRRCVEVLTARELDHRAALELRWMGLWGPLAERTEQRVRDTLAAEGTAQGTEILHRALEDHAEAKRRERARLTAEEAQRQAVLDSETVARERVAEEIAMRRRHIVCIAEQALAVEEQNHLERLDLCNAEQVLRTMVDKEEKEGWAWVGKRWDIMRQQFIQALERVRQELAKEETKGRELIVVNEEVIRPVIQEMITAARGIVVARELYAMAASDRASHMRVAPMLSVRPPQGKPNRYLLRQHINGEDDVKDVCARRQVEGTPTAPDARVIAGLPYDWADRLADIERQEKKELKKRRDHYHKSQQLRSRTMAKMQGQHAALLQDHLLDIQTSLSEYTEEACPEEVVFPSPAFLQGRKERILGGTVTFRCTTGANVAPGDYPREKLTASAAAEAWTRPPPLDHRLPSDRIGRTFHYQAPDQERYDIPDRGAELTLYVPRHGATTEIVEKMVCSCLYSSTVENLPVPVGRHVEVRVSLFFPDSKSEDDPFMDPETDEGELPLHILRCEASALYTIVACLPYLWVPPHHRTISWTEGDVVEKTVLIPDVTITDPPVVSTHSGTLNIAPGSVGGGPSLTTFESGLITLEFVYGHTRDDIIVFKSGNDAFYSETDRVIRVHEEPVAKVREGVLCKSSAARPKAGSCQYIELAVVSPIANGEVVKRLLSRLRYFNVSQDPVEGPRQIRVSLLDDLDCAASSIITVNVIATDNPAELTIPHSKVFYHFPCNVQSVPQPLRPHIDRQEFHCFMGANVEDVDTDRFCGGHIKISIGNGYQRGDGLTIAESLFRTIPGEAESVIGVALSPINTAHPPSGFPETLPEPYSEAKPPPLWEVWYNGERCAILGFYDTATAFLPPSGVALQGSTSRAAAAMSPLGPTSPPSQAGIGKKPSAFAALARRAMGQQGEQSPPLSTGSPPAGALPAPGAAPRRASVAPPRSGSISRERVDRRGSQSGRGAGPSRGALDTGIPTVDSPTSPPELTCDDAPDFLSAQGPGTMRKSAVRVTAPDGDGDVSFGRRASAAPPVLAAPLPRARGSFSDQAAKALADIHERRQSTVVVDGLRGAAQAAPSGRSAASFSPGRLLEVAREAVQVKKALAGERMAGLFLTPPSEQRVGREVFVQFTFQGEASIKATRDIIRSVVFAPVNKAGEYTRTIDLELQLGMTAMKKDIEGKERELHADLVDPSLFQEPLRGSVQVRVTQSLATIAPKAMQLKYVEGSGAVRIAPFEVASDTITDGYEGGFLRLQVREGLCADDVVTLRDDASLGLMMRLRELYEAPVAIEELTAIAERLEEDRLGRRGHARRGSRPREDDDSSEEETVLSPRGFFGGPSKRWSHRRSQGRQNTGSLPPTPGDVPSSAVWTATIGSEIGGASRIRDASRPDNKAGNKEWIAQSIRAVAPGLDERTVGSSVSDVYFEGRFLGMLVCTRGFLQLNFVRPAKAEKDHAIGRKEVTALFKALCYANTSRDPRILSKVLVMSLSDGSPLSSQVAVEIQIQPVDDVTEILLRNDRLRYRPCQDDVLLPFPICPLYEAKVEDPDTMYFDGGYLWAEIIAGAGKGDELGVLDLDQQREQIDRATAALKELRKAEPAQQQAQQDALRRRKSTFRKSKTAADGSGFFGGQGGITRQPSMRHPAAAADSGFFGGSSSAPPLPPERYILEAPERFLFELQDGPREQRLVALDGSFQCVLTYHGTKSCKEARDLRIAFPPPQGPRVITREVVSYLLNCLCFTNDGTTHRLREGLRTVQLRIGDGVNPQDGRQKLTVDVRLPFMQLATSDIKPISAQPGQTVTLAPRATVNHPEQSPVCTGFIEIEIVSGYHDGTGGAPGSGDMLLLNLKDSGYQVRDGAVWSKATLIAALATNSPNVIRLEFTPACRGTARNLTALLRGVAIKFGPAPGPWERMVQFSATCDPPGPRLSEFTIVVDLPHNCPGP